MPNNGWFCDLERAIKVFRDTVKTELFSSITVNALGDFVIKNEEGKKWIVTHDREPKIYEQQGHWNSKNSGWTQLN